MDILDISQIKEGKLRIVKETFPLPDLIQDIHDLFKQQIQFKNLKLNITNALDKVYTDQRRLKQILINLISNSLKVKKKNVRGRETACPFEAETDLCLYYCSRKPKNLPVDLTVHTLGQHQCQLQAGPGAAIDHGHRGQGHGRRNTK